MKLDNHGGAKLTLSRDCDAPGYWIADLYVQLSVGFAPPA